MPNPRLRSVALALAAALVLGTPALAAAEQTVALTLDGRPVDRNGGNAVMRGGAVYADVIDLVKAFNGLLTLQNGGQTARVELTANTTDFTVGARSAKVRGQTLQFPAPVFKRNGDIYVPVAAFVAIAGAKVRVNAPKHTADIVVNTGM